MSEVDTVSRSFRHAIVLTSILAAGWLILWFDWIAHLSVASNIHLHLGRFLLWIQFELIGLGNWSWFDKWLFSQWPTYQNPIQVIGFCSILFPVAWWLQRARKESALVRYAIYSFCIFPIWHFCTFAFYEMGWMTLKAMAARVGLGITFVVGLGWTTFWVERKSRALQVARLEISGAFAKVGPLQSMHASVAGVAKGIRVWNPLDMDAWFYGHKRQKLRQSLSVLFGYLFAFILIVLLLLQASGCQELYEMPAGGGEQKQLQQVVKVQKVIKKKFIINPLSSVIFNPPPLEEIKLQLLEITKHAYQVGYGKGAGAGFSGGTNRGKVRFIRLEYSGGDWDQGIDADLNMLIQYNLRTQHKIAERPETRKVAQLKNFPVGKSPPIVYMTGQKNISLGKSETDVLRAFLTEKHGMLFADNGGSAHWGNQFKALMGRVLPKVSYIRVPLDHPIHRVPYPIPFLPYVAPHGGTDALAWVVNGRIAAYYHPGDIGDAWADDHAGVPTPIWEACYQLGTNVIFYAHAEYNKWLDSRKKSD